MTKENVLSSDESVAAILGLVLVKFGGKVELTQEEIAAGLPENSGIGVDVIPERDVVIVRIADNAEQ